MTLATLLALATAPVFAQFTPAGATITTTVGAQTLSSGTGTVNAGGAINIASGGALALNMTGTSTLINNGIIRTFGTGRAIDSNSGIANLTITNTGLISSVSTDAFRVNTNSTVSLTNSGTIQVTAGGQAIDWAAITSKSNTLTNLLGGVITAVGEDAVRPGTNGVVINAGTISATPTGGASPSGSDGIDLRTFTGISVTNTGTISGRHGIATDGSNSGPSTFTLNNNAGTISAVNGSGLNIDGVSATVTANVTNLFGATIKGGVTAAATDGDGDGIDVDGVLTLSNSGDVLGLGAKGGTNNAEGVAAGGGTIINTASGRIIGSSLLADAPNGDSTRAGNGILIDDSNGGNAVAATSITNAGLIEGKSGFAIKIVGNFDDTIDNQAGGIIRGASSAPVIDTGGGNDTVTNAGFIFTGAGTTAVALGAGNDQLNITGTGVAGGGLDGGTGIDTLNLNRNPGSTFVRSADAITNFEHIEVASGRVQLSGSLSLGSDTNTLHVASNPSAILDLDTNDLVVDHGSVAVDGLLSFAISNATTYGQLFFGAANGGGLILGDLARLSIDATFLPSMAAGQQFTLVDFLGDGPFVTGTFAGFSEGTSFKSNGLQFEITYQGNEGHDIVLTYTVPDTSATLGLLAGGLGLLALARRRTATQA